MSKRERLPRRRRGWKIEGQAFKKTLSMLVKVADDTSKRMDAATPEGREQMIAEMIADDKALIALWDEKDGSTNCLFVKSEARVVDEEVHVNVLRVPSLEHAELLQRKINGEKLS